MGEHALPTREPEADPSFSLHQAAVPIRSQSCVMVAAGLREPSTQELYKKRKLKPGPYGSSVCKSKEGKGEFKTKNEKEKNNGINRDKKICRSQSVKVGRYGEDSIRWSKFSFSAQRKSYHAKLIRAFQVVKTVSHPMLTLISKWGLNCYYKLAVACTMDQPLEMAAACLPELRKAVYIIHSVHFQKLSELKLKCQMLLYAVLNCHINWVDFNHKQILLMPGQPSTQPPREEGDLRCSRCLKNQTFHSSKEHRRGI